jgi:alpha-L-fucosidase
MKKFVKMMTVLTVSVLWLFSCSLSSNLSAAEKGASGSQGLTTTSTNYPDAITNHTDMLNWWQDQRFGIFIHWGPASMSGHEIGWGDYPRDLASMSTFNPSNFNATSWMEIIKNSGARYINFVTMHMDGYCMFDTAFTNYNIMNSAYGKDITKMIADAAHAAGLGLGLYYCPTITIEENCKTAAYRTRYTGQVCDELLAKYGKVFNIWYDTLAWNGSRDPGYDALTLINRMRERQPWVLVNNRCDTGAYADYATPEGELGNYGYGFLSESCMCIQPGQWAWSPTAGVLPLKTLLDMIIVNSCCGGNTLLNIGPRPDGTIDPAMTNRLAQIGSFMSAYGESIYGTRKGPIAPGAYGGTTVKNSTGTVYVHLNKGFTGSVTIPLISSGTLTNYSCLTGGTPTVKVDREITITLPTQYINALDTIIVLNYSGWSNSTPAPIHTPGHSPAPTTAPAPTPIPGRDNDGGNRNISYEGSWTYSPNQGAGCYYGDEHYTLANGNWASYTFTGTGIRWIGVKDPSRGLVDVYIDSVFQTTVTNNLFSYGGPQPCYEKLGLASGVHTIKLVKKSGNYMDIDAFDVITGGSTPLAAPTARRPQQ